MSLSREELLNLTVADNTYTSTFDFNAQMEENTGVGAALTEGLAASVVSGAVGIVNTGIAVGNMFGAEAKLLKTEDLLKSWDWDETYDYYEQNKSIIDGVGFALATLAPGTIGLKAAKYAQAAASANTSKNMLAIGMRKVLVPSKAMANFESQILKDTMHIANRSNITMQAAKQGIHQAAVETAFAETAILLSTNQHVTVNQNQLGYFDAMWDQRGGFALGFGLGTSIGGLVYGATTRRGMLSLVDGVERGQNKLFQEMMNLDSRNNRIGFNQGNKVVQLSNTYKTSLEEFKTLAGADLAEFNRRKTELFNDLWEEVAVLTGEASKTKNIVGRREVDGHLTPAIMRLIDEGEIPQIADMFHGSSSIGKYDDMDFIFDPVAQPLTVFETTQDYANGIGAFKFGDEFTDTGVSVARRSEMDKIVNELAEGSSGISSHIAQSRFREQFVDASKFQGKGDMWSNESVLGVIRHELGHGNTVWMNQLFGAKLFQPVTKEMTDLSRLRRPAAWVAQDRRTLVIDRLTAQKTLSRDQSQTLARLMNENEYLENPLELMADSWAMFNARDPRSRLLADKLGGTTKSLMENNGALRSRLGESEKLVALKTGKLYDTAQWAPTTADRGVPVVSRGVVKSGDVSVILKPANFSILNTTPDEASAYYFAAIKDGKRLKNEVTTSWDNFYDLVKIQEGLDKGTWAGKVTIKLEDGTEKVLDASKSDILSTFDAEFITYKSRAAEMLNKRELNKRNNTTSDIARIIDSDENFAISNGLDNSLGTQPHWTPNNPVGEPTVAKVFYKTASDETGSGTSALADSISQNTKVLETNDEMINSFIADFEKLVQGEGITQSHLVSIAPEVSWKQGTHGDMADINRHAKLTGVLKTFQGMYGESTSKLQAIGKFNELFKLKGNEQIQRLMANVSQRVSGNRAAVMELNVLDSKLRQQFYKFAPKFTNAEDAAANLGQLIDRVTPEKGLDNISRLLNSATGTKLLSALSKDQGLWTRDIEALVTKIVNQKKFVGSNMDKLERMVDSDLLTVQSKDVFNFWKAKVAANKMVVDGKKVAAASRGFGSTLDEGVLYPGAINATKFKHRKFIIPTKDEVWSGNQKGIIGASTPTELAQKEAQVRQQFGNDVKIVSKEEMEDHFKKTGEFLDDFSLNEFQANRDLTRKGVNWDVAPEADENLVAHYVRDTARDWAGTTDNLTELKYSEEFASLQQGDSVAQAFGTKGAGAQEIVDTPFREAQNIMLNRTNQESSKSWRDAQGAIDKTVTKVFNGITGMFKNAEKTGSYEEMNAYMDHYGLPKVYADQTGDMLRTSVNQTDQALQQLVPKVNGIAATLMLRLDFIQPMINALSMPIMSVPEMNVLMRSVPTLRAQQVAKGVNLVVPETKFSMGSNFKLQMQAVKDFFSPEGKELLKQYYDQGIITNVVREMRQVADDITIDTSLSTAGIAAKVNNAASVVTNKLAKPADWAEDFVKFIAARQADLVMDAAGITDRSIRSSTLRSYTTRVHGNYVHAQRPAIFQGFAGQAIGLFQTYQFNLIQSLLSKVSNKNGAAVASMMGIQAGMFGVQSVPGFRSLNEYIAGNSQDGNDFYTGAQDILGKEESEWMLFGLASNFTKPLFGEGLELYTRGDLNPRTPFLIPTSLAEVPIWALSTKFLGNILNAATDLSQGVDAGQVMADTLAHNGVNRPLAGVGAILAGTRTTSKGTLIANLSDLSWFAKSARALGTKTLDESIAVQSFYRTKGYDTKRNDELQSLGRAVKRQVQSDTFDEGTYQGFFEEYNSQGGSPEKFGQWMHTQTLGASESTILKMYDSNNSSSGRYLQRTMGYDIESYIDPNL